MAREGLNLSKQTRRQCLEEKALQIWRAQHEEYQTIRDEYHELLEKKRELGLPLKAINTSILREFPTQNLDILRLETEEEVNELVSQKTEEQLAYSIKKMKEVKSDYVYRTLCAKVNDYRNEIKIKLNKDEITKLSRPGIVTTVPCKRTSMNG